MAFYVSEYQRALFHIKEMQLSADHQLNYLLNSYAAIIADNLAWVKKTMQDAIDELNKNLDDGNKSINTYISQSNEKLATLNTSIGTAQTRMDGLAKQITGSNLVTTDNLYTDVQVGINTGKIDLNANDAILDKDISSKVDLLTSIIEGSEQ
jgi:hypothetical protein